MDDDQLRGLINLLWKTTFVLDTGTRLKPMPIEWAQLTPKQQTVAVSELRRLLIAELKRRPSGKRLHLEFNAIPRKLKAMLVEIAGDDNPDLTWGLPGKDVP